MFILPLPPFLPLHLSSWADDEDSLSLSEHGAKHYLSESVHTASFCASVIRSASLVEESRINKADSKLEPDDDEEEDFEKGKMC